MVIVIASVLSAPHLKNEMSVVPYRASNVA